jgi:hypothetical protein
VDITLSLVLSTKGMPAKAPTAHRVYTSLDDPFPDVVHSADVVDVCDLEAFDAHLADPADDSRSINALNSFLDAEMSSVPTLKRLCALA